MMARCGRCGLWAKYPEDHREKKYAGTCLYYRLRLPEESVWEERKCPEFFERIPGWTQLQLWNYALRHQDLGRTYRASRRALFFSLVALALSISGFVLKLF